MVKDVGAPPVPAATVTVTLVSPATTVGVAGAPGAVRDCRLTTWDPAENSPVVSAPVAMLLFNAATRNEYVPSAKPVAVQLVEVDDFVEPLAHPEPAADHGPFTPDATCTSYPTSLFAELTTFACSHVTSTCPAPVTLAEIFDAASSDATSPLTTGPAVAAALPSPAPPPDAPPHAASSIAAQPSTTTTVRALTEPAPVPMPRLPISTVRPFISGHVPGAFI